MPFLLWKDNFSMENLLFPRPTGFSLLIPPIFQLPFPEVNLETWSSNAPIHQDRLGLLWSQTTPQISQAYSKHLHLLWVHHRLAGGSALHQPHSGIQVDGARYHGRGQGYKRLGRVCAIQNVTHYLQSHFLGQTKPYGQAQVQKWMQNYNSPRWSEEDDPQYGQAAKPLPHQLPKATISSSMFPDRR